MEYPGNTMLYAVARSLLFPTPEAAHEHPERVRKGKKAIPPPSLAFGVALHEYYTRD